MVEFYFIRLNEPAYSGLVAVSLLFLVGPGWGSNPSHGWLALENDVWCKLAKVLFCLIKHVSLLRVNSSYLNTNV